MGLFSPPNPLKALVFYRYTAECWRDLGAVQRAVLPHPPCTQEMVHAI